MLTKPNRTKGTYIPTPMPVSSIFLLKTVSILPCVIEYSSMKASKMNATNILKSKGKEKIPNFIEDKNPFVCLSVICLSRSRFWRLFRICGPAIPTHTLTKDRHTGNFIPYTSRLVCGFFNVPHRTYVEQTESICVTGPTDYSPYPKRLETECSVVYCIVLYCSVIPKAALSP